MTMCAIRPSRFVRLLVLSALLLPLLAATGCRTAAMKGTPFYRGEYAKREGPVADRVNLWPLAYYRDPALSVLWPIFEHTDDHWAIRPLVSLYGLDRPAGRRTLNILWPIAQFDWNARNFRVFPFFWSRDHFVLFPLVWREGGSRGHFVVFPFYWDQWGTGYRRVSLFPLWVTGRKDVWAAWPFVRWSREANREKGGRFWPFYGYTARRDGSESRHWWLWPLGWHGMRNHGTNSFTTFFPLYFAGRSAKDAWWCTPLGGVKRDATGGVARAGIAPLFYHSRDGGKSVTLSPVWMQGRDESNRVTWQTSFPFFYSKKSASGSVFSSLPWSQGRDAAGRVSWRLCPPFFYWGRKDGATTFLTLPWMQKRGADGRLEWSAVPLLYEHRRLADGGSSTWVLPYYEKRDRNGVLKKSMVLPLGGRGEDGSWWSLLAAGNAKQGDFYSWLFGWKSTNETGRGFVYPLTPLVGVRTGRDKGGWLFPLFWSKGDRASGNESGRWLLLGSWKKNDRERKNGFFPLWGYKTWAPPASDANPLRSPSTDSRGTKFWCLPACWYKSTVYRYLDPPPRPAHSFPRIGVKGSAPDRAPGPDAGATNSVEVIDRTRRCGFFPLWAWTSKSREREGKTQARRDGGILGWLYDWKREIDAKAGAATPEHDYYRTRVLWRLWHYERLNGDVSVDVFPGLTFDRKADGFRKTSFLWRLYRNERGADGSRKVDLLFIPIVRSGAKDRSR